jgi:hypothetical protein
MMEATESSGAVYSGAMIEEIRNKAGKPASPVGSGAESNRAVEDR